MSERYIWDINLTTKIRIKEIREYKINYDSTVESFFVTAHGTGFGHGITIHGSKSKEECVAVINSLTPPIALKKDSEVE